MPIPIDEITKYHLALRLGFADLHETLNVPRLRYQPDIFGAIWVHEQIILIDQSLNPDNFPSMLGRYRFSVGHEIGHWRLHRSYVDDNTDQTSIFDIPSGPTVICRSSQAREPIEWQADYYSSCLLMPRKLVNQVWLSRFGDLEPLNYEIMRKTVRIDPPRRQALRSFAEVDQEGAYDAFANGWADYFAQIFSVSAQAMRIRLEHLGLLQREKPRQGQLVVGP